jgi:preprotein translocase subunit SecE
MKRMMQRQGQMEADGSPSTKRQPPTRAPRPAPSSDRLSFGSRVVEFAREVRSELRQVAWPTRAEVANSATVVFIVLVLLVTLIFLLNYGFSHAITWLFKT